MLLHTFEKILVLLLTFEVVKMFGPHFAARSRDWKGDLKGILINLYMICRIH